VPAYFGAIVLAILVVLGKSLYPRWTVLANFGLLSLFAPLAEPDSRSPWSNLSWWVHESFDRNFFSSIARLYLEPADDLTNR
jgi:hypothetical protein